MQDLPKSLFYITYLDWRLNLILFYFICIALVLMLYKAALRSGHNFQYEFLNVCKQVYGSGGKEKLPEHEKPEGDPLGQMY